MFSTIISLSRGTWSRRWIETLAVLALVAATVAAIASPAQAAIPGAAPNSPVNPDLLGVDPIPGGGVEGFVQPSVGQNWKVHAFAQVVHGFGGVAGTGETGRGDEGAGQAANGGHGSSSRGRSYAARLVGLDDVLKNDRIF